jgi:hypothetical protein
MALMLISIALRLTFKTFFDLKCLKVIKVEKSQKWLKTTFLAFYWLFLPLIIVNINECEDIF